MQHQQASHIETNPIKGIMICLIGYFFVSLVGLCSKSLSSSVTIPTILFVQNGICLFLILPEVIKNRINLLKINAINTYLIRIVSGLSCYAALFYIIRYIPISEALLYQYSASLWMPFMMFIWLQVRMPAKLWTGILIGFLGIALILKPTHSLLGVVSLVGILCGILQGLSMVGVRKLALIEPLPRMLFYYFFASCLITLPFIWRTGLKLGHRDLIILIILSICVYLSQKILAVALKYAHPTTLAPICYTSILFSGLLGWIYWKEIPDHLTLIGMLLVMLGCLVTIAMSRQISKPASIFKLGELQ